MTRSIVIGGHIGCGGLSARTGQVARTLKVRVQILRMDRQTFAHNRMLMEYDDRSSLGTCGIMYCGGHGSQRWQGPKPMCG
jgi:hypothetical protein